jgi:catechol 2,3-dioxygenase-like lactoylglutathione lyase family enzyme
VPSKAAASRGGAIYIEVSDMDNPQVKNALIAETPHGSFDMKLELVVLPVSDADRAKRFYGDLGWRLDLDFKAGDDYRVVQLTPPGSGCSVIFGKNITEAEPGSAQGLYLVVSDIELARNELLRRGAPVGELFHDAGGVFHHADGQRRMSGANPKRQSYATFASFSDPDGNQWFLQEITARLSADIQFGDPMFTSEVVEAIRGSPAGQAA